MIMRSRVVSGGGLRAGKQVFFGTYARMSLPITRPPVDVWCLPSGCSLQLRDEFVRHCEPSPLERRWRHLFDGVDFLHGVHPLIDFRSLHLRMAQPERYLAQIAG